MRIRIEIRRHEDDPGKDLEIASSLRRDLWVHSPIEIDPDDPALATRRTPDSQVAYFEFETDYPDEVERVVNTYAYTDYVTIVRLPTHPQPSTP